MKKIFLTGINSNLGKDLLIKLLNDGYYVYGTYNSSFDIELFINTFKNSVGENINSLKLIQIDLSDIFSLGKKLESIIDIDVVINNASIRFAGDIKDFSYEDYSKIYNVNVFSIIEIYKYFSNIFKKKKKGLFINLGSIGDKKPFLYDYIYSSTKNALYTLNIGFKNEGEKYGYNSILVYFGPIKDSKKDFINSKHENSNYFYTLKNEKKLDKKIVVDGIIDIIEKGNSDISITFTEKDV